MDCTGITPFTWLSYSIEVPIAFAKGSPNHVLRVSHSATTVGTGAPVSRVYARGNIQSMNPTNLELQFQSKKISLIAHPWINAKSESLSAEASCTVCFINSGIQCYSK